MCTFKLVSGPGICNASRRLMNQDQEEMNEDLEGEEEREEEGEEEREEEGEEEQQEQQDEPAPTPQSPGAVVHQGKSGILTSRTDLFKISKFLLVNGHVIKSRNHGGGMRLHQRVLLLVSGTVVYVLLVGTSASRVFEMEPGNLR